MNKLLANELIRGNNHGTIIGNVSFHRKDKKKAAHCSCQYFLPLVLLKFPGAGYAFGDSRPARGPFREINWPRIR
ncbi:hypothetical protein PUN28_018877 [Cardiocondyla obscurior]|uniref:Uncharacterized protein n=1 Tax=Cardiocondyla obscurior TaxID=286306 RepID=A0AAW2EGH2_9HYME